jgi:hypothetical protein
LLFHIFFTEKKIEKGKRKRLEDTIYYHLHAGFASAGQRIFEHSEATRVSLLWKKADPDSTEI